MLRLINDNIWGNASPSLFDELPADAGRHEGERRRDMALSLLSATRPVLVRRVQRQFLLHLLEHDAGVIDDLRPELEIPATIDPRFLGAAIRSLSTPLNLIVAAGFVQSQRPESHARTLRRWRLRDRSATLAWLADHPELGQADGGAR